MFEDELQVVMMIAVMIMMTTAAARDHDDGTGGFPVILIKPRFFALERAKTVAEGVEGGRGRGSFEMSVLNVKQAES